MRKMRIAVLGNGRMSLCFDGNLTLKELTYPTVGLTNHADRVELFVAFDNELSLVGGEDWDLKDAFYCQNMSFRWAYAHKYLPVEILVQECLGEKIPLWTRKITVLRRNRTQRLPVAVYQKQKFSLLGNKVGETAFWEPSSKTLYHYKGPVWMGISAYSDGAFEVIGKVAKVRDGGVFLNDEWGPSVEHGFVESAIGLKAELKDRLELSLSIALGEDKSRVDGDLHSSQEREKPREKMKDLKRISISILKSHQDKEGGVVASLDDSIMTDFWDHYRYVWPRDAAMCAMTMMGMGEWEYARKLLRFLSKAPKIQGFLHQRYRPDGHIGSGWHPWDLPFGELPIQEDETALSLILACEYLSFGHEKDVLSFFNMHIREPAQSISDYVCASGEFVRPSFDLWEERRGIFSFTQTISAVGLLGAHKIAKDLSLSCAGSYLESATKLLYGLTEKLAQKETGFSRGALKWDADWEPLEADFTPDSSLFLIPVFLTRIKDWVPKELFEKSMALSKDTWLRLRSELSLKDRHGDILYARYKGDWYGRNQDCAAPGNPWFISTAWGAMSGHILGLLSREECARALTVMDRYKGLSGHLSEQLLIGSFSPASVCPLPWSHAAYLDLFRHLFR